MAAGADIAAPPLVAQAFLEEATRRQAEDRDALAAAQTDAAAQHEAAVQAAAEVETARASEVKAATEREDKWKGKLKEALWALEEAKEEGKRLHEVVEVARAPRLIPWATWFSSP